MPVGVLHDCAGDGKPADDGRASATILQLQVTARSYPGAMVLHCGGLLVDDGWLRVFASPGSGAAHGVPRLVRVNRFPRDFDCCGRPRHARTSPRPAAAPCR
ncbi:DUF2625 family protein [Streptomyces atratus]|uniref:DUF2625 family protein n=1 Tax=Streptomyces atratus TaxID=1893 RepID=UPI002AC35394|nr:DUF2625 family protein [Streptomyces atratus]WPW33268.1 DUF2625 family protein [Streptomyces atratus]